MPKKSPSRKKEKQAVKADNASRARDGSSRNAATPVSGASCNNPRFTMVLIFPDRPELSAFFKHIMVKQNAFTVGRDHETTHTAGKQAILDCVVAALSTVTKLTDNDKLFFERVIDNHYAPRTTSSNVFGFRREPGVPSKTFMAASQSVCDPNSRGRCLFCYVPADCLHLFWNFTSRLLIEEPRPTDEQVPRIKRFLHPPIIDAFEEHLQAKRQKRITHHFSSTVFENGSEFDTTMTSVQVYMMRMGPLHPVSEEDVD